MHCPAKTDSEMPSAGEVELQLAGLGTSARTQKIDLHPHNQIKNLLKQGIALLCMGDVNQAIDTLKQACKVHRLCKAPKELQLTVKNAMSLLPSACCSEYWSACITQAQEPNPLSSRDGRRLKPVPNQWKLTQPALVQNLQDAMQKLHSMQLGLLLTAWGSSKQPDKANLALMRGFAYVQAGRHGQALKDARVVLAYAPKVKGRHGICSWPWAHGLHSAALEGLQDNVAAALAMQTAHELDPACSNHSEDLERLMRRIPLTVADVLEAEGSVGLQQWLAEEEERRKPEFLKQRPKYYYYYEWMKQRICATHPALPEPVMDKLLTMPANDLDLILQHKESTTWKVDELMGVLEEGGPALLEGYPLQKLSWEQVKKLKGPNLVGLGVGPGPAPGEGMLEHGPDRHEQLKLRAQKQGLLEGNSAQELPACCSIDTADESGDDQEDLDALTY